MNAPLSVSSLPIKRPSSSNSATSPVRFEQPSVTTSKKGLRASVLHNRSASPDLTSKAHSLNSSRTDANRPGNQDQQVAHSSANRWSYSSTSSISGIDTNLIRKRTSSSGATRKSSQATKPKTSAPFQDQMSNGRYSPRSPIKRPSAGMSLVDSSRLNFQDSSNATVVRDLSHSGPPASMDISGSKWERRTGVNKHGDPVSGLSIQYNAEPTDRVQALPNGAALPERRSSTGQPGHRSRSANRSKDNSQTSIISGRSDQSRKGHRSPQQKDMLSKALAKANIAVLLDNAQDITGAIEAYNEACLLLEQVMVRSTDPDDRRKLSAIKATYSSRIAELHEIDQAYTDMLDKALPDEPPLDAFDEQDEYFHDDSSFHSRASKEAPPVVQLPLRQESLLPQIFGGDNFMQDHSLPMMRDPLRNSQLNVPMDRQYMPSPLTPRHQLGASPTNDESFGESPHLLPPIRTGEHGLSEGATSWLDNFDATSSRSSSRLSYDAFGQQNGQLVSDIEAEFDAAMNAAVEAAYEDQPSQEPTPRGLDVIPDSHHPQPEAATTQVPDHIHAATSNHISNPYLDADGEDEERLLDELTREFGLDGPASGHRPTPSIPRQSDSSGFSSRTWGSSVASTTVTAGTTLSTLAEITEPAVLPPAPVQSPPKAPARHSRTASQLSMPPNSGEKHIPIRDRRMSGQSAKQLKIETFSRRGSLSQKPLPAASVDEQGEVAHQAKIELRKVAANPPTPLAPLTSEDSSMGESPPTAGLSQVSSMDEFANPLASPTRFAQMMPPPLPSSATIVRKNVSSTSLRKQSLSINTGTADPAESPATPGSAMFPGEPRRRPSMSTPAVSTPGSNVLTTGTSSGLYLFDDHVGTLDSPRTSELNSQEPAPLEPCPESFLLRPFWLMRSLYLALSHPHGGFVTQKLFLPRDMWRVRNVKIKALEDKISTCDLLTAALQKLSQVDTLDADSVLAEMQSFEGILDQARGTLAKKLGSDVGVAGTNIVFKSPAGEDVDSSAKATNSSAAKSFASWGRKLRSKSSSANLNTTSSIRESTSQNFTMPTLPMTTLSSVQTSRSYGRHRNPPPTPSQLPSMLAPMAVYMSSLARLFEAAQILDSIARQVEDPGLKYSSSTQVGLELSMRVSAEFFAFYVVRFVMSDLLLLVDKFLKRSSEWVMA